VAARHRRISAEHLFRIVKAVGIVAGVILLVAAYQPIASSSLFALKRVSITGHTRFPPSQAEAVVRDVMDGNVLKGDLTEVREQLKQRPLIKDVVVTRIWPDTLRVELIEREPVAVVALSSGKLVCVDQEGTVLGDFELLGAQPPLLGWDERRSTLSRSANQQRLQLYLELKQALSRSDFDYWNQVDQVNVRNLRDVVISLEHSPATEIHLGHRDFHQRFSLILNILEDLLRGQVQATYIDVSDPSRVVIRPPTRSSEPAPASRRVQ
jgi:cell division protein FtsQ